MSMAKMKRDLDLDIVDLTSMLTEGGCKDYPSYREIVGKIKSAQAISNAMAEEMKPRDEAA
jgi:hypothetical protein